MEGFLESTLDKDTSQRTFVFGENEKRRLIIVELDDLVNIFKGLRPRHINSDDFKQISGLLRKELQRYKKGTVSHLSKVNDLVWKEYTKNSQHKIKQKGVTYVKKTE